MFLNPNVTNRIEELLDEKGYAVVQLDSEKTSSVAALRRHTTCSTEPDEDLDRPFSQTQFRVGLEDGANERVRYTLQYMVMKNETIGLDETGRGEMIQVELTDNGKVLEVALLHFSKKGRGLKIDFDNILYRTRDDCELGEQPLGDENQVSAATEILEHISGGMERGACELAPRASLKLKQEKLMRDLTRANQSEHPENTSPARSKREISSSSACRST